MHLTEGGQMKTKDLTFIALRLLAIYLFFLGISQSINVYYIGIPGWLEITELQFDVELMVLLYSIPPVLSLSFGVLLWFFANKLTTYLIRDKIEISEYSADFKISYTMIIAIVGIVIIIQAGTGLVEAVPTFITYKKYIMETNPSHQQFLYEMIAEVTKLIIGASLVVRADGVRVFVQRIVDRNK